jgi:hypothetical protein
MFRPVPCSAFSEPSYFVTTRLVISSMNAAYFSTSALEPKFTPMRKCRLPAEACPATFTR